MRGLRACATGSRPRTAEQRTPLLAGVMGGRCVGRVAGNAQLPAAAMSSRLVGWAGARPGRLERARPSAVLSCIALELRKPSPTRWPVKRRRTLRTGGGTQPTSHRPGRAVRCPMYPITHHIPKRKVKVFDAPQAWTLMTVRHIGRAKLCKTPHSAHRVWTPFPGSDRFWPCPPWLASRRLAWSTQVGIPGLS